MSRCSPPAPASRARSSSCASRARPRPAPAAPAPYVPLPFPSPPPSLPHVISPRGNGTHAPRAGQGRRRRRRHCDRHLQGPLRAGVQGVRRRVRCQPRHRHLRRREHGRQHQDHHLALVSGASTRFAYWRFGGFRVGCCGGSACRLHFFWKERTLSVPFSFCLCVTHEGEWSCGGAFRGPRLGLRGIWGGCLLHGGAYDAAVQRSACGLRAACP